MYNVVLEFTDSGTVVWSQFNDKADFDDWYNEEMKEAYLLVQEDVTEERANELCSISQKAKD
jgi:hypothetical protein